MQKILMNREDLEKWSSSWVSQLVDRQLILLSGTLGSGKTAFTSQILKALGCEEGSSPTYGLIHEYSVPSRPHCFHVDLYRLKDEDDLESSGFWDLFQHQEGLIFVEWADRLPMDLYPLQWSKWAVEIEKGADDSKRLYKLRKI